MAAWITGRLGPGIAGPADEMEPLIDALSRIELGKLRGCHRHVPDSDLWSISPVVHTRLLPGYRGAPGAIQKSQPHCLGISQLGPGLGPKPAQLDIFGPTEGICSRQLDASLPEIYPFLSSEDVVPGSPGHHIDVKARLHPWHRPMSLRASSDQVYEELILRSLHPTGASTSSPNALPCPLPPGQTRIPPLHPNRRRPQRGRHKVRGPLGGNRSYVENVGGFTSSGGPLDCGNDGSEYRG